MMNKTKIQYLDYTWNPIAMRCTPVSAGCANCWHLRMCDRLANNPQIPDSQRWAYAGKIGPQLVEHRLDDPLKLKKPAVIGAQFMGDLFFDGVVAYHIEDVWRVMQKAHWHTFLVLTKRPERAHDFLYNCPREILCRNVWIGVTVESQSEVNRILEITNIPASKFFVSFEPLLGEIAINPYWLSLLSLMIVGCESGPGRRFTSRAWITSLRDQCLALGDNRPSFYLKQMYVDGKVASMPELDGQKWEEWPK